MLTIIRSSDAREGSALSSIIDKKASGFVSSDVDRQIRKSSWS